MSFDPDASPLNMPELSWAFGYPLALGVMLAVGSGMIPSRGRAGSAEAQPPRASSQNRRKAARTRSRFSPLVKNESRDSSS